MSGNHLGLLNAHSLFVLLVDEAKAIYSDAAECDMAPFPCVQIIATWAVGVSGSCLLPDYGVPIGQGGAQYVILQVECTPG